VGGGIVRTATTIVCLVLGWGLSAIARDAYGLGTGKYWTTIVVGFVCLVWVLAAAVLAERRMR
jgi:hypothetical protein